jgi:uncharacterized protein
MDKQRIIEILRRYREKNSAKYGITAMGIFGSVARDQSITDRDIDVFVETETPNPFNLVHIKEELEDLCQIKVDIVRLRDNMNEYLSDRIKREGIYV